MNIISNPSSDSDTSSVMSKAAEIGTECTSIAATELSNDSLSDFAINVIGDEEETFERFDGFEFVYNGMQIPALSTIPLIDSSMDPLNNQPDRENHFMRQFNQTVNETHQLQDRNIETAVTRSISQITFRHFRGLFRRGAIRRRRQEVHPNSEARHRSRSSTIISNCYSETHSINENAKLEKLGYTVLYHQLFVPAFSPPPILKRTWLQKVLRQYPIGESIAVTVPSSPLTALKRHHQDLTLSIPVFTPIPRAKRVSTPTMIQHDQYEISEDGLIINFNNRFSWLKLFFRRCDLARSCDEPGEWIQQIRDMSNYDFELFRKIAN